MTRKQFFIIAAIIVATGFLGGLASSALFKGETANAQEDDTITAQTLKVVDAQGNPRIILTTSDDTKTPIVMILDEKAAPLQVYSLSETDEPVFTLMDKKGAVRLGGATMDADGPALFINDQNDATIWGAP